MTPTPERSRRSRIGRRARSGLALAIAAALMSGCVTSPYWNQTFASHTDPVPLAASTTSNTHPVVFSCSPAYHGGTHPPFSAPTWTTVASRTPTGGGTDSNGLALYSASANQALPSACWRQDPANGQWYAAVRATQQGGPAAGFYTFTQDGLTCMVDAVVDEDSWVGWLDEDCHQTYAGSSTPIPFVVIRATS